MRIRFCTGCVIIPASPRGPLCWHCWYAEGELCISCHARKGQRNIDKHCLCGACKNRVTCGSCESAPVSARHPPPCKRCSKRNPTSETWCVDHGTVDDIRSGLCRPHFNEGFSPCDSCNALICIPDLVRSICSGKKCREDDLRHEVHACVACAEALPSDSLVCSDCHSHGDRVCIVCRDTPAQKLRKFARCCVACYSTKFVKQVKAEVLEESRQYLARPANQQTWEAPDGAPIWLTAPALGLYMPPLYFADQSQLRAYSDKPDYLSPSHCRICHEEYTRDKEAEHLLSKHDCTPAVYRRDVLRRSIAEWLIQISPQILRTGLAAFKTELSVNMFRQLPCASYCRFKRKLKLTRVVFPPPIRMYLPHGCPGGRVAG